jgi:hypothetical protein
MRSFRRKSGSVAGVIAFDLFLCHVAHSTFCYMTAGFVKASTHRSRYEGNTCRFSCVHRLRSSPKPTLTTPTFDDYPIRGS